MKNMHMVAWILVMIGAVNWGLVGLGWVVGGGSDWNVVHMILGSWAWAEWVIYVLVGVSGIMLAIGCKCDKCKAAGGGAPQSM